MEPAKKFSSYYNNKNIVLHELIGLDLKVVKSMDRAQQGISGRVINETKNTLVISTPNGTKRLVKKVSVFRFSINGKKFVVDGNEINFRPYERIEKALKFYKRRRLSNL